MILFIWTETHTERQLHLNWLKTKNCTTLTHFSCLKNCLDSVDTCIGWCRKLMLVRNVQFILNRNKRKHENICTQIFILHVLSLNTQKWMEKKYIHLCSSLYYAIFLFILPPVEGLPKWKAKQFSFFDSKDKTPSEFYWIWIKRVCMVFVKQTNKTHC